MTNYNMKSNYYSLGKPNPKFARSILSKYKDIKPEDVLLVGDSMSTDIRLAVENGFKSLLVLSGNTKKEGIDFYVIEPDLILESISDLKLYLKKYSEL